jgi:hypothetical protein
LRELVASFAAPGDRRRKAPEERRDQVAIRKYVWYVALHQIPGCIAQD